MKKQLIGIDIGGTKCAVTCGIAEGPQLTVVDKIRFETTTVRHTIEALFSATRTLMQRHSLTPQTVAAIGISSGGPLDSTEGLILSPPNLPGWNNIRITQLFEREFGIPTAIQNDANACALAEWKFGAGVGTRNMVFMTFGTGLGAGLILNGALYAGQNDNAGELGHIRLARFGAVGYGKAGSFEGFCSGGGIAQLAKTLVLERLQMGEKPALCPDAKSLCGITALRVAEFAAQGDPLATEVFRITGNYLGKGLSILIDLLNPELIVIGSIYARCEALLAPYSNAVIEREALSHARRVCRVVPARLGEQIGDMAALSVAANLQ